MKPSAHQPFHSRREARRSAALILILGCLVILTLVLVAFLSSAKTELVGSKTYADNAHVRTLMNTCVNLVYAQIRQATTVTPTDCWTSQPGLIRTFNNSGAPDMSYKLYSSPTMQVAGALIPTNEEATIPATWSTQTAIYTDLNDPVSGVYPIVDPAATNNVQGFSIDANAPTTSTQGAPMPVNWLYVLSNGTLVAPTMTGTGTTATIAGASASNPIVGRIAFWTDDETCKVNINTASEGGSFNGSTAATTGTNAISWDEPYFQSQQDSNLAVYQPTENEFQNYPGHPAGVSLSAVFTNMVASSGPASNAFMPFYALAPRIQSGGSYNGTLPSATGGASSFTNNAIVVLDGDRLYDSVDELLFNTNRTSNPVSGGSNTWTGSPALTQTQVEQAHFFLTAHSRAPETTLFGTPKVACWPISAYLPVAAANNTNTPYASAFDNLIAYCSTLSGTTTVPGGTSSAQGSSSNQVYYFERQNKDSQTNDYNNIPRNKTLYTYLHTLMNTQVPGFGGNLGTKYGSDSDQILTEIFDYIRCTNLLDLNLPSETSYPFYQYAAGGPATAGGANHGLGVNEVAPITITGPSGVSTRGFGRITTIAEASLWLICTADPTVAATANTPLSNSTNNLTLPAGTLLTKFGSVTKQVRIEAALLLDPFTPMQALAPMRPDLNITISKLDSWTLEGSADTSATNLGFPSSTNQISGDNQLGLYQLGESTADFGLYSCGGYMSNGWSTELRGLPARNGGRLVQDSNFLSSTEGGDPLNEEYPFVSQPVTVNVLQSGGYLTFSGGTITVTIQQRTATGTIQTSGTAVGPGATIQTLTINFPSITTPVPTLPTSTTTNDAVYWTFQAGGCGLASKGRFTTTDASPVPLTGNDVLYSMVPAQSNGTTTNTLDPRFVALTGTSGAGSGTDSAGSLFSPHPSYKYPNYMANTLLDAPSLGLAYNTSNPNGTNSLAAGLSSGYPAYKNWPAPKAPWPAAAAMSNGDWDNGIGVMADGGYVNEPDPGSYQWTYGNACPPYYGPGTLGALNFTSPSRMMPSPGMFGSLPTTFLRSQTANFTGANMQGWQTLLFRRQPTHPSYVSSSTGSVAALGGGVGAGNFSNEPDYLMMDLFWMPVVEPYALSEVLSTAGKINMNYQVIPFTYLERQTGLYAVLKHEDVISVPSTGAPATATAGSSYKGIYNAADTATNFRLPIQIAPTLMQFAYRFNNSDGTGLYAYRTPSEICDVNLIPSDVGTLSTSSDSAIDTMMATYWASHSLTGDNCRERPYTTIYPRLTTRSNTFRVHYRVQTLQQIPSSTPGNWTEGTDVITSEGRGSVLIERYLDPNDTTIPDYATAYASSVNTTTTPTLESHYQFRVDSINRFPP